MRLITCLLCVILNLDAIAQDNYEEMARNAASLIYQDPAQALALSMQGFKLAQAAGDSSIQAYALKITGNVHYLLGNYAEALDHFTNAQLIYQALGDSTATAAMYGSEALVHKATEEYEKALETYDQAYNYLGPRSASIKAKLLNNEGTIYRLMENFDKAEQLFLESLELKKQLGDQKGVANTYTNLGNMKADEGKNKEAFRYFFKSQQIENQLKNDEGIAKNYNNLANLHLLGSSLDSAIWYAKKGLKIAEKIQTKIQIKEASEVLASAYEKKGNFKAAYNYFKLSQINKDSLYNEEEARKIGRLESKLDLVSKQKEVELLEERNRVAKAELMQKQQQQLFLILITILIVVAGTYVIITQQQRSRLKHQALEGEIAELRNDIKDQLVSNYQLEVSLDELNKKLVNPLSDREYDVLKNIFTNKTNQEIAEELYVSINTVKTHLRNLYNKLGVTNRKEALEQILKAT